MGNGFSLKLTRQQHGLDEPKKEEAPITVAVSSQGYFQIRGLKPNRHYKLTARAKQGEQTIAGVTYAKAPDIHVVIRVSADLVTPSTPGTPAAPTYAPKEDPKKTTLSPSRGSDLAAAPNWAPNTGNRNPGVGTRGHHPAVLDERDRVHRIRMKTQHLLCGLRFE